MHTTRWDPFRPRARTKYVWVRLMNNQVASSTTLGVRQERRYVWTDDVLEQFNLRAKRKHTKLIHIIEITDWINTHDLQLLIVEELYFYLFIIIFLKRDDNNDGDDSVRSTSRRGRDRRRRGTR